MVFKPMHSAHRPKVHVAAPPRPERATVIPDKCNQRAANLPYNRCKRCRTGTAVWEAMPCGHLLYCDTCKRQVFSRTLKRCSICRVRIMNFVRAGGPRPAAAAGSAGPQPAATGGSAGPRPAAAGGSGGPQRAAAAAGSGGSLPPDPLVASAIVADSTAISDPQPVAAAAAGSLQPAAAAADLVGTFTHSASVVGAPQLASAIADSTDVSDAPSN